MKTDQIRDAAEAFRNTKEAVPEFDTARRSQLLHQAAGNLAYYSQLAAQSLDTVKTLAAALDDGKDQNIATIRALAADVVIDTAGIPPAAVPVVPAAAQAPKGKP